MKTIEEMSIEELKGELISEKERNIELTAELNLIYSRLDIVSDRLEDAVRESLHIAGRLAKAKEEFRKLRDTKGENK